MGICSKSSNLRAPDTSVTALSLKRAASLTALAELKTGVPPAGKA